MAIHALIQRGDEFEPPELLEEALKYLKRRLWNR
jgi:hypothetical protein